MNNLTKVETKVMLARRKLKEIANLAQKGGLFDPNVACPELVTEVECLLQGLEEDEIKLAEQKLDSLGL